MPCIGVATENSDQTRETVRSDWRRRPLRLCLPGSRLLSANWRASTPYFPLREKISAPKKNRTMMHPPFYFWTDVQRCHDQNWSPSGDGQWGFQFIPGRMLMVNNDADYKYSPQNGIGPENLNNALITYQFIMGSLTVSDFNVFDFVVLFSHLP